MGHSSVDFVSIGIDLPPPLSGRKAGVWCWVDDRLVFGKTCVLFANKLVCRTGKA